MPATQPKDPKKMSTRELRQMILHGIEYRAAIINALLKKPGVAQRKGKITVTFKQPSSGATPILYDASALELTNKLLDTYFDEYFSRHGVQAKIFLRSFFPVKEELEVLKRAIRVKGLPAKDSFRQFFLTEAAGLQETRNVRLQHFLSDTKKIDEEMAELEKKIAAEKENIVERARYDALADQFSKKVVAEAKSAARLASGWASMHRLSQVMEKYQSMSEAEKKAAQVLFQGILVREAVPGKVVLVGAEVVKAGPIQAIGIEFKATPRLDVLRDIRSIVPLHEKARAIREVLEAAVLKKQHRFYRRKEKIALKRAAIEAAIYKKKKTAARRRIP